MTTLNPLYISSTPLQWVFIDKDTGTGMDGGIVTFYEQDNQNVLKPIYQLDNSSPTGFSELNNPIQLTAVGTFADNNGNDIIPYFYPYNLITGLPELYYVTVYNSAGVLQFTRQDWPPNMAESGTVVNANEIINYIANGQFLLHNNNYISANITTKGTDTVQYIAPGGWTFERESNVTSLDPVTFLRKSTASSNPLIDANPRYYVQIATNGNDSNYARKDLCLMFPDVNKFAGNTLTFSWQGFATAGGSPTVTVILRQYFGTGSSTQSSSGNILETVIGTQVISTGPAIYNISIPFPSNTNDTVSPTIDNDYLQICLRLPNSAQTVQFTDFVLTPSVAMVTGFPQTPNDIFIEQSTIGYLPTPSYTGSDLYLPLVTTPQGTAPDYSQVGTIVAKMTTAAVNNELLCDGTAYQTSVISPIGVPYARLQAVLFNSSLNAPIFGTGANWVNAYINSGTTSQLILSGNKAGSQTIPADSSGATATGFTFPSSHTNTGATSIGYVAHANFTNANVTAISTFTNGTNGSALAGSGTSGMTIGSYNQGLAGSYYAFTISVIAASALAAGSATPGLYFTFSNHTTNYYVWFYVNGETDPAPGGTGIVCNLVSTMAASDVAIQIANVISRYQNYPITVTGQPTNGAGSYFTFYSNAVQTAVWYQVAGNGSAPAIASNVKVILAGTENASQVAAATQNAINSAYFAVPNLQGVFLRGLDNSVSPLWDLDIATRTSLLDSITTTLPGTLEFMNIQTHVHPIQNTASAGGATVGGNGGLATSTGATGGSETRPVNVAVNYFIKY